MNGTAWLYILAGSVKYVSKANFWHFVDIAGFLFPMIMSAYLALSQIDVFPVWNAWGHALIRMEHYAQARVKFK